MSTSIAPVANGQPVEIGAGLQEFLSAQVEEVALVQKELDEVVATATRSRETERLHTQSAEQAEADADSVRLKIREAITAAGPGASPTKAMLDLKGKQRSAFALAEEYHALAKAASFEADKLDLQAYNVAAKYKSAKTSARSKAAERLIEVGLAKLPWELIAGIKLKIKAEAVESAAIIGGHPNISSAHDLVFRSVRGWIEKAVENGGQIPVGSAAEVLLADGNLHGFGKTVSYIQRKKMLDEIEAKEAAHQQEWGA